MPEMLAVLDSIDGLDAALKPYYVQVTDEKHPAKGKWMPNVKPTNGFSLEHVTGIKEANLDLTEKRDRLKAQLAAFDGLDAAQARDALKRIVDLERAADPEKIQQLADAKVGDVKKKLEADIAVLTAKIGEKDQAVRNLVVRSEALRALAEFKGNPDLLLPHIEAASEVRFDEGKPLPVASIRGEKGSPMVSRKPGAPEPMGITEFVGTVLRERFPQAFEGSGHSGTGATGANMQAGANQSDMSKLPPVERLKELRRREAAGATR